MDNAIVRMKRRRRALLVAKEKFAALPEAKQTFLRYGVQQADDEARLIAERCK